MFEQRPSSVTIVEVGPRDGLQNESTSVSVENKVSFINQLALSGLSVIEAGAMVSPKWVPTMADSAAVLSHLSHNGVRYPVLVPNRLGYERAKAAGVQEISVFVSASETFSQKNLNASIAESLEKTHEVITQAVTDGLRVRGYISCVAGCPYEGKVSIKTVGHISLDLLKAGVYEISLGDTIGVGHARQIHQLLGALLNDIPVAQLAAHFHDTYGQALANVLVALECGITTIDSAVAGLGGCPYAKGASGNLASEDLVYLLSGLGVHTGIDLTRLIAAGDFICKCLGQPTRSKVALALQN